MENLEKIRYENLRKFKELNDKKGIENFDHKDHLFVLKLLMDNDFLSLLRTYEKRDFLNDILSYIDELELINHIESYEFYQLYKSVIRKLA